MERGEASTLPADSDPVPVVRRRRAEQQRTRRAGRRTVWWQLGTTIVFGLALVVLAVVGYRASLLITGGGTDRVTDPAAPGYVAEVKPTPVDMVAVTAEDGSLASVLVVSTPVSGSAATVSVLPASMAMGPGTAASYAPIGAVFEDGGLDELRTDVGVGLTFGFSSAEQITSGTLKALAGLAGPLTVNNIDNLIDSPNRGTLEQDPSAEVVRYRAGEVVLQPDEVAGFLSFAGVGESPDRQMLRQQAVWEQLLTALRGKDLDQLVAADDDKGAAAVADLLAEVGGREVTYEPVPVMPTLVPGTIFKAYVPDPAALPTFVARVVPFPTAATPGQRARVELLNGTTNADAALLVAPKVVAAGGEISLLGNADSFDKTVTTVEYLAPEAREAADEIATALGVKASSATAGSGGVDVRVVVGADRTS